MQIITRFVPKRIWHQIGLAFALMLTIALLIAGFLLINASRKAVTDSVLRDYEEITTRAAKEISFFVDKPKNLLLTTATVLGTISQHVRPDSSVSEGKDIDTRKVLIYQLMTDYPDIFERLALIGLDGQETVNSDLETNLKYHSKVSVFQSIITTTQPAISKVYFSDAHFPYIMIGVPVKRLNELNEVLIAEVKLNRIWKTVEEIQLKQSQAFLVDENGYILVHNEEKKVYQGDNLKRSEAVQSVLQGKTGSIEEGLDKFNRDQWLSAYAPIAPFGWGLIIRQPIKSAYAFSFRMQRTAMIIIALAICMAVLLSLVIANWISRPIKELTEVTSRVAAGNLDVEIKTNRTDEIGNLMTSFNEMIQRLRKSRRLERLSNIGLATSKIAHELRNPLAALKAFTQLLPRRYKDEKFIAQFQETVPAEMARLEKMLGTLTAFSAGQKLQLSECDLNQLVKSTVDLFREQMARQKVVVSTGFEPDNISLSADGDKIKQVLINLVRNALESMPQGGSLNVNTKISPASPSPSVGKPAGGYDENNTKKVAEIKINDTGNGMDMVQMQDIFEPFYTTKPDGLGLGLAICKEIIEQHQGMIAVESQKDKGTSFTIRLPIRR